MTDKIVILCTCASADEARKIARALLDARAAACVNIIPGIQSLYRWQGAIESSGEWMLVIKSSAALFGEVRAVVERNHSYDVPEVIALPVADGAPRYLAWLEEGLKGIAQA